MLVVIVYMHLWPNSSGQVFLMWFVKLLGMTTWLAKVSRSSAEVEGGNMVTGTVLLWWRDSMASCWPSTPVPASQRKLVDIQSSRKHKMVIIKCHVAYTSWCNVVVDELKGKKGRRPRSDEGKGNCDENTPNTKRKHFERIQLKKRKGRGCRLWKRRDADTLIMKYRPQLLARVSPGKRLSRGTRTGWSNGPSPQLTTLNC